MGVIPLISSRKSELKTTSSGHVRGLDTIRFICAAWVFFAHKAAPPLSAYLSKDSSFQLWLTGFCNNLWNGPAAVIVFFVISGFCIHYPFAGTSRQPFLPEFYSRRFLRLLIPMAIAIPLGNAVHVSLTLFQDSILWSLLAELIYYLIYPALRAMQVRGNTWTPWILGSSIAALLVVLTNPAAGNYPSYGSGLNWILGLPCWLLGCALAESVRRDALTAISISVPKIWGWRGTVFAAAWATSVARFHSPIGFPWTLNLFALLVAVWLKREIAFRKTVPPVGWLESAGLWSYSLYLLHLVAGTWFEKIVPPVSNGWLHWLLISAFVFGCCYLFYLLVERPSHAIARRVSQSFRQDTTPFAVPEQA